MVVVTKPDQVSRQALRVRLRAVKGVAAAVVEMSAGYRAGDVVAIATEGVPAIKLSLPSLCLVFLSLSLCVCVCAGS